MYNPNLTKIAKIIVDYSTKIKKNEVVQIIADVEAQHLALEVYKSILQKGAYPRMHINIPGTLFTFFKYASDEQLTRFPKIDMDELKQTDATIFLGAPLNTRELTNINSKKISLRQKTLQPYNEYRVNNTKWVIFYYPTHGLAQESEMSYHEFREFVFKAVNVDYKIVSKGMDKLKKVIDKGNNVRIIGNNTDLSFSIKGRTAIKGDGEFNLPDGEVFTGPVEDSANGYIEYDYPIIYHNQEINRIGLKFKNGKIIESKALKNEKLLNALISTDEGSCYLGEFGIGTNYKIKKYIKNILFDEKIGGTIHLAIGNGYKDTGSKNKSAVHFDMVKDLRRNGKLIIDGKIIQENGKFIF